MANRLHIPVTTWVRLSLCGVAINFLAEGAISLASPGKLTSLVEIAMPTRAAVMEIRSVYGGFFFGTGFFLLVFAFRDRWLRPGLVAQAAIFGGFVIARALSIAMGDTPNSFMKLLFAGEAIGLMVALVLLRALDGAAVLVQPSGEGGAQ
jgi:hypothetical protein